MNRAEIQFLESLKEQTEKSNERLLRLAAEIALNSHNELKRQTQRAGQIEQIIADSMRGEILLLRRYTFFGGIRYAVGAIRDRIRVPWLFKQKPVLKDLTIVDVRNLN
jgi:hypothetical protein